jgi:hypothetical protein
VNDVEIYQGLLEDAKYLCSRVPTLALLFQSHEDALRNLGNFPRLDFKKLRKIKMPYFCILDTASSRCFFKRCALSFKVLNFDFFFSKSCSN